MIPNNQQLNNPTTRSSGVSWLVHGGCAMCPRGGAGASEGNSQDSRGRAGRAARPVCGVPGGRAGTLCPRSRLPAVRGRRRASTAGPPRAGRGRAPAGRAVEDLGGRRARRPAGRRVSAGARPAGAARHLPPPRARRAGRAHRQPAVRRPQRPRRRPHEPLPRLPRSGAPSVRAHLGRGAARPTGLRARHQRLDRRRAPLARAPPAGRRQGPAVDAVRLAVDLPDGHARPGRQLGPGDPPPGHRLRVGSRRRRAGVAAGHRGRRVRLARRGPAPRALPAAAGRAAGAGAGAGRAVRSGRRRREPRGRGVRARAAGRHAGDGGPGDAGGSLPRRLERQQQLGRRRRVYRLRKADPLLRPAPAAPEPADGLGRGHRVPGQPDGRLHASRPAPGRVRPQRARGVGRDHQPRRPTGPGRASRAHQDGARRDGGRLRAGGRVRPFRAPHRGVRREGRLPRSRHRPLHPRRPPAERPRSVSGRQNSAHGSALAAARTRHRPRRRAGDQSRPQRRGVRRRHLPSRPRLLELGVRRRRRQHRLSKPVPGSGAPRLARHLPGSGLAAPLRLAGLRSEERPAGIDRSDARLARDRKQPDRAVQSLSDYVQRRRRRSEPLSAHLRTPAEGDAEGQASPR